MNDGTQPLGPILVFSKKDDAFAARLPPLASRWRAIMPRGDVEEIAVRDSGDFRFLALPTTRALLE